MLHRFYDDFDGEWINGNESLRRKAYVEWACQDILQDQYMKWWSKRVLNYVKNGQSSVEK
jgi:hypothetical protein